ncbi:MAG: DUF2652 domain-containing protein [Chitinophagaceae bacterium]
MAQSFYQEKTGDKSDGFDGLLFIPDISGFTRLVHATDVLTGRQITRELLSAIIGINTLQLNVAEIEGDAVLFYRGGAAPSPHKLFDQYEKMVMAFEAKRKDLERKFSLRLDLSLKVIAHYGTMAPFRIGSFKKLYGQVVVEAHRLLKNSVDSNSYLLLTDSLFRQPHHVPDHDLLQPGIRSGRLCEVYDGLRKLCFTYFDFTGRSSGKQVA